MLSNLVKLSEIITLLNAYTYKTDDCFLKNLKNCFKKNLKNVFKGAII